MPDKIVNHFVLADGSTAKYSAEQLAGDVPEVVDIRTGYDGTVYGSAGEAVRTQFEILNSNLEYAVGDVFSPFTLVWNENGYISNSGVVTNANNHYTDFFSITNENGTPHSLMRIKKPTKNDWVNYCFYNDNEVRVGSTQYVQEVYYQDITPPAGATKCRISSSNSTYQNVTVSWCSESVDEKIDELKREMEGLLSVSWNDGGYINNNGNVTENINNHYSDYIELSEHGLLPKEITVEKPTTSDWMNYAFYDNNNSFLSHGIVKDVLNATITIPVGASKLRVSTSNATYYRVYLYVDVMGEIIDSVIGLSNTESNVTLNMNGNNLLFASELSGHLMSLTAEKTNSRADANPLFNFVEYKMDGSFFKTSNDDCTPIRIDQPDSSATYIGAGHGFSNGLKLVTSNTKTDADIGSVWKDANNREFVIYNVGDGYVKVVKPTSTTITSPLTHVSGATNTEQITFTSSTMDFLLPAINKHSLKFLFPDGAEIVNNGTYHDKFFDVVESYNIIDPVSAIEYLKRHVGQCTNESIADTSIQALCKVNLVYRITKGCACTVYQSVDSIESIDYLCAGMVQSQTIGDYAYVPDAFANDVQHLTETTVEIGKNTWNDQTKVPYRYYEFSDSNYTKGFFLGYYPNVGLADNEKRLQKCTKAGMYYSNHKMYPYLINNTTIASGETVEAISFRTPIIKRNDGSLAVTFNYVGEKIVMCVDYQDAFNGFIDLIDDCVGKQIEVIDKTDNCTITREIASSTQLPISFGGKGYAVLEFH